MIRLAASDDAGWITDLWNAVIADTLVTFTSEPKDPNDIAALIARQPVLVIPGQGFASYGPFRGGPGYAATAEHTIYMAQSARRQGQGAVLLSALFDYGRSHGIHVMVAGISGANPGAVRFHARLGFETVGTLPQVGRKGGQWLDLILMQKFLNS